MGIFETLAELGQPKVPGIDWNKLFAQHGTLEAVVATRSYVREMQAAREAAAARWNSVGLNPALTSNQSSQSISGVKADIDKQKSEIEKALSAGWGMLTRPVEFKSDQLRDYFTTALLTADRGFFNHSSGLVSDLKDAERITKVFNSFVTLYDNGTLNGLKLQAAPQVSGLGWVVAVIIAVAAVSAIAIIAYMILASSEISRTNKATEDICKAAAGTKDEKLLQLCGRLAEFNPITRLPQQAMEATAGKLTTFVGIGLLVFAGIYLSPYLIESLTQSKKAYRSLRTA
jgi:hypothetical protein